MRNVQDHFIFGIQSSDNHAGEVFVKKNKNNQIYLSTSDGSPYNLGTSVVELWLTSDEAKTLIKLLKIAIKDCQEV